MEYEKAKEILLEKIKTKNEELVDLEDSFERVIARDIISDIDIPNFRRSPLDGYCFMSKDTKGVNDKNPIELKIVEEVPCGSTPSCDIKDFECIKVMTGAKLPESADCVCPYEIVEEKDGVIKVYREFSKNENVIEIGEDIKKGSIVANKGDIIDIGMIGIFSQLNIVKIPVYEKIKIGILSTGSELLENGATYEDGKIYNSNRYMLISALKKINVDGEYISIVKDNLSDLKQAFGGKDKYDIIISTGGVSVGDYDLVRESLLEIGAEVFVNGINIKPGMACCFAKKNETLYLCLSGNPMSSITTFYVVCMPVIKKMMGIREFENKFFKVKLNNSFDKITKADRFLRSKIDIKDGELVATLNIGQGNIVIKSMIKCNSFIKLEKGMKAEKGNFVEAFLI